MIPGAPPNLLNLPDECPFRPRCPKAVNRCRTEPLPPLEQAEPQQFVACYNPIFQEWDATD